MTELTSVIELLRDAGPVTLLIIVSYAWWKGWIVPRREFRAMETDRNLWRDIAMRALRVGEVAVTRRPDEPGSG